MDWEKVERVDKSERQRSSVWKTDDALSTAGGAPGIRLLFPTLPLVGVIEDSMGMKSL